jgi:DNA-binding winged helix-turn-helix (wHTH) protein
MQDPAAPGRSIRFGPFDLNVRSGELHKGPTRLKVPDQSIEILKALSSSRANSSLVNDSASDCGRPIPSSISSTG